MPAPGMYRRTRSRRCKRASARPSLATKMEPWWAAHWPQWGSRYPTSSRRGHRTFGTPARGPNYMATWAASWQRLAF
eukprot:7751615-Lingulodinium_polyedra.AAC.1